MTPISKDILSSKIAIILRELELLERLEKEKISANSDIVLQHALSHATQNLIAAVIDIAQHLLAESDLPVPNSYAESIENLASLDLFPVEFLYEFSLIAGLRNIIVHAYGKLDINRLCKFTPKLIKDIGLFLNVIEKTYF